MSCNVLNKVRKDRIFVWQHWGFKSAVRCIEDFNQWHVTQRSSQCERVNGWTDERMNEQMNERMNERMKAHIVRTDYFFSLNNSLVNGQRLTMTQPKDPRVYQFLLIKHDLENITNRRLANEQMKTNKLCCKNLMKNLMRNTGSQVICQQC